MKRIGLISDTHLQNGNDLSLKSAVEAFGEVNLILHAGDVTGGLVLEFLETVAPVQAVRGNMDNDPALCNLPVRRLLEVEGVRIGLIHGWGSPSGLRDRVMTAFRAESPDVIVFGHSHHPEITRLESCLLVNPGSACDRRFAPYKSVGILEIRSGSVDAEICTLP